MLQRIVNPSSNRGPHPAHCSPKAGPCAALAPRARQNARLLRCAAAEKVTFSVADLPAAAAAPWAECASRLEGLGLTPPQTETIMVKAFGWGSQAYWRHEKEGEAPALVQVDAVLAFLASLGIASEEDQAALVAKFPEVLGLEVGLMEENVAKLKSAFFLKGTALTGAIKRKPRALGVIIDCEGSCAGLCTRCFAQF